VALSDIYAPASVVRPDDALVDEAFAFTAPTSEQCARCTPEASARHLTRRADRLEVRLAPPDLSIDQATLPPYPPNT
jgi:hypothetical protein